MRTTLLTAASVVAVGLVAPRLAAADDTFEAKAAGARVVKHLDELVWAMTATCDKGDDTQQRQCRQVRDARKKAYEGATLLVHAEAAAFEVGAWNPAKKTVPLALSACIQCTPLVVDGTPWIVTGAAPRQDGGKLKSVLLYDNARGFADESAAKAWAKAAAGARVELVVKPAQSGWSVGETKAFPVEIQAWRVVTPCSGAVIIASPASGSVAADKQACNLGDMSDAVPALTSAMVQATMKPVVDAATACARKHAVAGRVRLELTIAADGTVSTYAQTGDFVKTPTGACIDDAMKGVHFPRSQKPRTRIGFPIVL